MFFIHPSLTSYNSNRNIRDNVFTLLVLGQAYTSTSINSVRPFFYFLLFISKGEEKREEGVLGRYGNGMGLRACKR